MSRREVDFGKLSLEASKNLPIKSIKAGHSDQLLNTIAKMLPTHFEVGDFKTKQSTVWMLAIYLAQHWNKDLNYAHPSEVTIQSDLQISKNTRIEALRVLRTTGWFGVMEGRKVGQTLIANRYFPLWEEHSRNAFIKHLAELETVVSSKEELLAQYDPRLEISSADDTPF